MATEAFRTVLTLKQEGKKGSEIARLLYKKGVSIHDAERALLEADFRATISYTNPPALHVNDHTGFFGASAKDLRGLQIVTWF